MIQQSSDTTLIGFLWKGLNWSILLGALGWISFHNSGMKNWTQSLSARGEYTSLSETMQLGLSQPSVELKNLNSIWTFQLKNKEPLEMTNLKLQLPIGGFYKIQRKNQPAEYAEFQGYIPIQKLGAFQEAAITVWSTAVVDVQKTKETKLIHNDRIQDVEFPVQVDGLLAWIIQSRHAISLLIFLLALKTLF